MKTKPTTDRIDAIRAQWRRELPAIDTSPLATIGRIHRVQFLLDARIRRTLALHGLDLGSFDVLATLRRAGPPYRLSPTVLYRELALSSGAMTHRMDVLEGKGLIERVPDPGDRRGTLAGLTASGSAVIEGAMRDHMRCEDDAVACLSAPEREQLAGLLKKLLLKMEENHVEG